MISADWAGVPPAGNGTLIRIGRLGKTCGSAALAAHGPNASITARSHVRREKQARSRSHFATDY